MPGLNMWEKWQTPLFRVFARGCMHASGAHLPLDRCKNPRTGRGFLQIDEGQGKRSFRYMGYRFLHSLRPGNMPGLLLVFFL